jgi:hypothetical protein
LEGRYRTHELQDHAAMSRYLPTTHTFGKAEVQRLQRLPGSVDRNKGLQLLTPRDEHFPRPPDSARNADGSGGSGVARGGELSFRRPLQSARARLETVPRDIAQAAADMGKSHRIKAAGGRADHPSVRQNDPSLRGIATENTGRGYCKLSLTETRWGVDVAAEELNNPSHFRSSAASRKTLAHDGRRTRFSRRHRTFSDIQRHDHFNQLVEESRTPADGRAIRLVREVWDPRLSDVQRALVRLMPTSISLFPFCAPALRVHFTWHGGLWHGGLTVFAPTAMSYNKCNKMHSKARHYTMLLNRSAVSVARRAGVTTPPRLRM